MYERTLRGSILTYSSVCRCAEVSIEKASGRSCMNGLGMAGVKYFHIAESWPDVEKYFKRKVIFLCDVAEEIMNVCLGKVSYLKFMKECE